MSNGARIGNATTYRLRAKLPDLHSPKWVPNSNQRSHPWSPRKWLCSRNCSWPRDQWTNNGPTARNSKVRAADDAERTGVFTVVLGLRQPKCSRWLSR